jgi:hypothetical protein
MIMWVRERKIVGWKVPLCYFLHTNTEQLALNAQSNLHHANKGSRPAWVELEVSGDGALSVGNEINVRFALIQLALELY